MIGSDIVVKMIQPGTGRAVLLVKMLKKSREKSEP